MSRYGRSAEAASSNASSASACPSSTAPGSRSATTRTPWISSTCRPPAAISSSADSAVKRRRSGSRAPARPSGSVSSAPAMSRWPPTARESTAATRLATSTLATPPGRSAAARAFTTVTGSSTTSSRLWQRTRSALSDATSPASASPSPWTARTRSATPASAARRVSAASASGLASTTVTSCPACASGTANPPVPPPTSTTVNRCPPTRSSSRRSTAHTAAVRGAECGPGPNRSTPQA